MNSANVSVIQVAAIYQACDKPDVKRALFSATLSNGIDEWASIHLDNVVKVTVGIRYINRILLSNFVIHFHLQHAEFPCVQNI